MTIQFLCPKCQLLLEAPPNAAGMQATCPQCQAIMIIPTVEAEENSDSAMQTESPPQPSPDSSPPPAPESLEVGRDGDQLFPPPQALRDSVTPSDIQEVDAENPPTLTGEVLAEALPDDEPSVTPSSGEQAHFSPSGVSQLSSAGSSESSAAHDAVTSSADSFSAAQGKGVFSPVPRSYSVPASLTYGWEIMKANFTVFCIASIGVFSISLLSICTLVGPLIAVPALWSVMAMLSVQAARGKQPELQDVIDMLNYLPRHIFMLLIWAMLVVLCQVPLTLFVLIVSLAKVQLLNVIALMLFVGGGTLIMVRLGWVPFVLADRPNAGLGELLKHSFSISQGKTVSLFKLAIVTYCAVVGTLFGMCIGIVLLGIPIALGIGGGAYVLLDRDATHPEAE